MMLQVTAESLQVGMFYSATKSRGQYETTTVLIQP